MDKVSSDIVVIPQGVYKPKEGMYGIFGRHVEWLHCRDRFHDGMMSRFWHMDFLFCHAKNKRELIAEFIGEVENRLGLVEKTEFRRTNVPTVMFIRPSIFWFRQAMKFSLFTILLRAAQDHTAGKEIESAMLANNYLYNTFRAVKIFLSGRTRFAGWTFKGWHEVFANIPCCYKMKCEHKDRRCRRKLDTLLVPEWQVPPVDFVIYGAKWVDRFVAERFKDSTQP